MLQPKKRGQSGNKNDLFIFDLFIFIFIIYAFLSCSLRKFSYGRKRILNIINVQCPEKRIEK